MHFCTNEKSTRCGTCSNWAQASATAPGWGHCENKEAQTTYYKGNKVMVYLNHKTDPCKLS